MRFVAPGREAVDPSVFAQPPLSLWGEFHDLLRGTDWPDVAALNRVAHDAALCTVPSFVAQTPDLLRDGLHYEQRIAERGEVATRERNWHDLLNALIWLRFPALKAALNARQVEEIARVGAKQRSRAQQALTHFDEVGVVAIVRDPELLEAWDAHDWHGLFWSQREAWSDGRIAVIVFGHALLEHALRPGQLLVGKALAVGGRTNVNVEDAAIAQVAESIRRGETLSNPQELRPLPLSGIPGWHRDNAVLDFFSTAPCFRPLRAGRSYPPALRNRRDDAATSPWPSPPTR